MKYKSISMNFPKVSAIGMGHLGVDSSITRKDLSDNDRIKLLRFAIEGKGLNFIDTAENYGNGKSEKLIGKAIENYSRDSICIATKVSPENLSSKKLIKSCEKSLKRLDTDYIDLYQIHWPSAEVELEETLTTMNKLKDEGKIKSIGVSNFGINLYELAKQYAKIDAVQFEFNPIDNMQRIYLTDYQHDEVLMIGYSPFHVQMFGKKKSILTIMSQKYNVSIHELLLNWVSSQNPNIIPIFKSDVISHISKNLDASDFILDPIDKNILDETLSSNYRIVRMRYIQLALEGREGKTFYQTIEEAKENRFGLFPSPESLSNWLKKSEYHRLKPIKVADLGNHELQYILEEGQSRFWANAIYNDGDMDQVINAVII